MSLICITVCLFVSLFPFWPTKPLFLPYHVFTVLLINSPVSFRQSVPLAEPCLSALLSENTSALESRQWCSLSLLVSPHLVASLYICFHTIHRTWKTAHTTTTLLIISVRGER